MTEFLQAKLRDARTSVALYTVSSDVDGARIAQETGLQSARAMVAMLESAPELTGRDLELTAMVLQVAMAGVSRRLLESGDAEGQFEPVRRELVRMVSAYLEARSSR